MTSDYFIPGFSGAPSPAALDLASRVTGLTHWYDLRKVAVEIDRVFEEVVEHHECDCEPDHQDCVDVEDHKYTIAGLEDKIAELEGRLSCK